MQAKTVMRNCRRTVAAFTIGTAAFAQCAAFAQSAALEPDAGPQADSPVGSRADQQADAPIVVAPMAVAQVSVAPSSASQAPTAPVPAQPKGPAPMVAVPNAVYVTHFIAAPAGAAPAGLLARLRAALHAHAAGRDAGLVAQAVVQRLNRAGLAARYLAPGEPPPVTGWLIGGVFHLQGASSPAASESAVAESEREAAGSDVSITVADLEHGVDTPFAVLGAPLDASGGQSEWHPYAVPARLSFERADRNTAVAALAQQIVDAIVGNMTALRQADARAISP